MTENPITPLSAAFPRSAMPPPRPAGCGEGGRAFAGNHVIIEKAGLFIALCHLKRGTIRVHPGQLIGRGEVVGLCGNSGNSTEPHLHVQAMDSPDPGQASGVPISSPGGLPRNGTVVAG